MGASPAKPSSSANTSPFKTLSPTKPAGEIKQESEHDEAEVIDTRSLLERMKGTVEEMKRRKSLAPVATPVRLKLETSMTPARGSGRRLSFGSPTDCDAGVSEEGGDDEGDEEKENGVSHAQKVEVHRVSMEDRYKKEMRKLEELEEPLFSLLRPGVLEESRAQKDEITLAAKEDDSTPVMATESVIATPAEMEQEMEVDADDPQVNKS